MQISMSLGPQAQKPTKSHGMGQPDVEKCVVVSETKAGVVFERIRLVLALGTAAV